MVYVFCVIVGWHLLRHARTLRPENSAVTHWVKLEYNYVKDSSRERCLLQSSYSMASVRYSVSEVTVKFEVTGSPHVPVTIGFLFLFLSKKKFIGKCPHMCAKRVCFYPLHSSWSINFFMHMIVLQWSLHIIHHDSLAWLLQYTSTIFLSQSLSLIISTDDGVGCRHGLDLHTFIR